MTAKTCETCAFTSVPRTSTVCRFCSAGGVPNAPNWKATPEGLPRLDDGVEGVSPTGPLVKSDGSSASYYVLPAGAKELQDLISFRGMNSQIGEVFRACYRYGIASHSDRLRDAKKIKFYAEAEIARLEKYGG